LTTNVERNKCRNTEQQKSVYKHYSVEKRLETLRSRKVLRNTAQQESA